MNLRRIHAVLLLCLLVVVPAAYAASPNVVISQVYGGGGATSGSPAYANDYVELFNSSNASVTIGGWSLQYGASGGNFGNSGNIFTFPAGTSIGAGKYLLVKLGGAGTVGASFTADFTSTGLSMSATAGKVALVNGSASLACGTTPCTLPDPRIVDLAAWGSANNGEGGTTINGGSNLDSTKGGIRKSNGCQDTDNNNLDFTVNTVSTGLVPRTSAAPASPCTVSNLAPSINAPNNPAATVPQDSAPFTVSLSGSDDGGVYNWSATPGTGVSMVSVSSGQGSANVTYSVTLQPGFSGQASFTASLSDNVNAAVTRTVNISVTPLVVNNPPSIVAPANPITTVTENAAPFTVSLSGSDDNGVYNWSASAGSGVSAVVVSGGQGTSSATYTVTLQSGYNGTASFTATLSDGVNASVSRGVNITVTPAPPPPLDHVVISQVYGGGGNSGATYRNDYVELYNASTSTFDLTGWTIQYASATGTSWQVQPIGGSIAPGEYYLVSLATGGANGSALPDANVSGQINMSGTNGKVALARSGDALEGCPIGDPMLVDLVGYGSTSTCREGTTNAPTASNSTALFRKNGGATDSNINGSDFVVGTPNPRRTCPIVEIGPAVLSSDPRNNGSNAPRDASISVTFTEAVTVDAGWFHINCATTGAHDDATVAGGGNVWIITPNVNFLSGEQCSVTIVHNFIHDVDTDDVGPNDDSPASDYTFSFSTSTGTAPPYSADVHLTFGNPSGAVADTNVPQNYLMMKPEYALSYNRDRGTPNWVSWHLTDEWIGSLTRVDSFRPDPAVPSDWYRVLHTDYASSGFDRGHMVPNADRDKETSIPINQATFLMSNMIPQAPDNNQGPWAAMEGYLRTLLPGSELYIVAGGAGTGGSGSNGLTTTIANGHVTVPAQTWKVALVLPKDSGDDVSRVAASTRTIAVIMPNTQGIRNNDWQNYLVSVDQVEALTGYDFFANVSDAVENAIEAGVNGVNPPGVADQSVSTSEDNARSFTLDAANPTGNALTYTIVSGPSHGTLSGSDGSRTYTPLPDYNGSDSFTFRVADGSRTSNTATVTITVSEVNDAPVAVDDAKSTNEDTPLQFAASELTANDSAGPASESSQTLTVTQVTGGAAAHGVVALANGIITYSPDANYHGPASFAYEVCDNGVTAGLTAPQCASAFVELTVVSVNDAPSATVTAPATTFEGTPVTATAEAHDVDENESFTFAWTVTKDGVAFASGSGASITFTPDDNATYVVSATVKDAAGATGSDAAAVAAANIAPAIVAVSGPTSALQLGSAASLSVSYFDAGAADTHSATFTWDDGTTSTATCAAGVCSASHSYASTGVYGVAVVLADDDGGLASSSFEYVVVYDNNGGGFVTAGGWLDTPSGKATLNANVKYVKNQVAPTGNTQFQLGELRFQSTSTEWLVVAGANAQYKGSGTVNGAAGFGYLVTASDASPDKFRIRIWNKTTGATVYDNVPNASDDLDSANPQPLGGGSVVVHK
ncbi:MAG TPA: DNA/RNA non-specific endonuclease [Thermoanaerobaculia bacterium]|jgi:endonuclease G